MALKRSPEFSIKLTYRFLLKADHFCPPPPPHYLHNLGRGPLGDATYQISRLYVIWFQTRFFHVFPYIGYVKHATPGAGHFWPQGYNLNKLGRGPLDDASHQI